MKLPLPDTEISYCQLCRKYHGYETWCPVNVGKTVGRLLILAIAYIAVIYEFLIAWSVKLMLLLIVLAFTYLAVATVLDWKVVDPLSPLLRSIQ
jgi:hypothetical protein